MGISAGIVLIAIGVLLAVFVNTTVGIILAVLGVLAIVLGSTMVRPGGREVIIERERPVRREVVREREI
ncbi:MAG: hypothetical protein ACLGHL_05145 [Actinomycetota bacterium]